MLPLTDATTIEKKVIRPIAIVIKLYSLPPLVLIQLVAVPDKDKPIKDTIGPAITAGSSLFTQPEPTALIISAKITYTRAAIATPIMTPQ